MHDCMFDTILSHITKYENLLVVDGELTNLTGPYKVKLSRTFKCEGTIKNQLSELKLK